MKHLSRRIISLFTAVVLVVSLVLGALPALTPTVAAAADDTIKNDSLKVTVGDLGQISALNIVNNPLNAWGEEINFVLPNDTSPQNGVQHQWMGEMIFSVRSSADGTFPTDNSGFEEVDINKTLAAGGSTTASDASANLESNPYITKTVNDKSIEVNYTGLALDSDVSRAMKGFNVKSVYDMSTDDGSMLWSITISNASEEYLEFGDVGLPMPWNNKYTYVNSVYNQRVTAHTFAGADSGYAYAIRCSGEGNYILFTPVVESGARIEYVDNWIGSNNGVRDNRNSSLFTNWCGDQGGWQPGLSVYYIHSKDIRKTGRSYFEDCSSLILAPGESQTYQFKFSAVRAGDNTAQESATSANNASDSIEERENNMRSILYKEGLIDAIAVPSFQTALNMQTKLDLHYDENKIRVTKVDIQCVHENDPYGEENIPYQESGKVNNNRTGLGEHGANEGYSESVTFVEAKEVDGEMHHIYDLCFACIGNNSVRVEYQLKVGDEWVDKFTQYEFNVLTELDLATETHADFMVTNTQDTDPESATYGIFSDWYFASGRDSNERNHWGDDWSHDNINFIAMKNYLDPDPEQVKAIETYLIDFMWENYMANTQETYTVANYLSASGIYSTSSSPYTRTYSEMMECTGFFNMYRIVKAYPDLISYRKPATWYLEKAYGIYINRVGAGTIGFYGEQQVPDMIEALYAEGMTEEANNLKETFAMDKAWYCTVYATYPYGSEFAYDNTGEEGAFAAAQAMLKYYPEEDFTAEAQTAMNLANHKTRAMRGIQPTWYQYADPAFIGGESWWNFQYTASLAGSIMDDYMRYQETEDGDSTAWAARVNYAAKLSNFNAINMGQITDTYVGSVSWRYNMYKGGYGAMNVNDGGTRVMNNGWQDFSGESDEGLYGSLLRISADVINDPIFGLYGYGASVTSTDGVYTIIPNDGYGKRVNVLDEKIYVETVQDTIEKARIAADGSSIILTLKGYTTNAHSSTIDLSGAGLKTGFYAITVGETKLGQIYINANHEGVTTVTLPAGESVELTLTNDATAENAAPVVEITASTDEPQAIVPFELTATATDDGAPSGDLTYEWSAVKTPEGAEVTFETPAKPTTKLVATVMGDYTFQVSVSDGEKTTVETIDLNLAAAPERLNPVITETTGVQNTDNPSVADLHVEATLDELYHGTAVYSWEIVSQPEGGEAAIANADQQDAQLLVHVAGEYVVRVTVTDEDKSSSAEITVTMSEKADGVQRMTAVVTKAGVEPTLPESVSAIYPDGSISEGTVTWDAISAESYAAEGRFDALGTIDGTEIRVAVPVYVVVNDLVNVAPLAIPSAIINTPQDLGGVAGLNDGFDPERSSDTSHGVWHNWLGDQGGTAWVRYDWDEAILLTGMDAYYFKDGGGNFFPKDVAIDYLDENGEWKPVPVISGLGLELNQYNTTTFSPISTTALRMTMNPATLGVGVIEWKVYGYPSGSFVDTTALKAAIAAAEALDTSFFTDSAVSQLKAELTRAQVVLDNEESTQDEVNAATKRLNKIVAGLETYDGNLAYTASVGTSFVSSWEHLDAVNDGWAPKASNGSGGYHYGTWGNTSAAESVTYTWGTKVKLNSTDIYFWYDGVTITSGGIRFPAEYIYEYLDDDGNWVEVPNAQGYALEAHGYNTTSFDPVVTTALRVTMTKRANDYNGVGLWEWKVYGEVYVDPAVKAVEEAIDEIGEVTRNSGDAIEAARNAYDELPDSLKDEVMNYETLLDAEARYEEIRVRMVYTQVTNPADFREDANYLVVAWRYFGGSNADSTNGYVFHAENNGNLRTETTDGYATVNGEFDESCLWKLSYTNGKLTMQNVATGLYLGDSVPAASETAYALTIATGEVEGYSNFAIGTASNALRFSGSANAFSFGGGEPASEVTGTNACNLTIYEVELIDPAVEAVEKAIDEIGDVTKESKDAIDAARAAYDALDKDQQALVENYDVLLAAEQAYRDLITLQELLALVEQAADDAEQAADEAAAAEKAAEEARAAAEQAQKAAEEAAAAAGEDRTAAEEAQKKAEEAQAKAEAAEAVAEEARAAAEQAQKAAEEAAAAAEESNKAAAEEAAKAAAEAAKAAAEANKAAASAEDAAKSAAEAAEAMKNAQTAQAAAEDAQKAAEEAQKKAEEAKAKAEEAAESTAEDKAAAEKAKLEAEEAQKAAEDAQKAAEDAKAAAELAMQAAEDSNKEAAAAAALAAQYAQEMAETYKEIVRIKAELVEYLAQAQAAAEQAEADRKAAEEAQRKAEEAALIAARYAAMYELADLLEDGDALVGHCRDEYMSIIEDARAAVEAATSAAEVAEALEAAKAALLTVGCPSEQFTDVSATGWYHNAVDFMLENGYMNGISKTLFDVEGKLTRAQLVTILYRIAGEPETTGECPFTDIAADQWYTQAVTWAAENGIVNGMDETTFAPNLYITREQIAVILYRYSEAEAVEEDALAAFPDAEKVSDYAVEAMNWAVAVGLINGSDGKLLPGETATRAQIATIMMRFLQNN